MREQPAKLRREVGGAFGCEDQSPFAHDVRDGAVGGAYDRDAARPSLQEHDSEGLSDRRLDHYVGRG